MTTIPKEKINTSIAQLDSYVSLEDFLRLYANTEDGYKYEWNNGQIEKTKGMNQEQGTIQDILMRLFCNTKTFQEGGLYLAETDMKTSATQLRRPDLAIYLANQRKKMVNGENQIAIWVGEIISDTDKANKINKKIEEYFKAGVQVVWNIYPASNQVHVYTAVDEVTICKGERICSGQPALADFDISAATLFAYKEQILTDVSVDEDISIDEE